MWGCLRETSEKSDGSGNDKDTGLCRTGLDRYLSAIYPDVKDWIHDKPINQVYEGRKLRIRPDYRSEKLRMVIEYDGLQHYQSPKNIREDDRKTRIYSALEYRVVRIPYFIQLTNEAVLKLFGIEVPTKLFDGTYPSLGIKEQCTPAFLCPAGIDRMAREFSKFPEQYEVNIRALENAGDEYMTGVTLLKEAVAKYKASLV